MINKSLIKEFLIVIFIVALSRFVFWLSALVWNILHNSNMGLIELLCQWDAGWYSGIVTNGYMKEPSEHPNGDAANWAFFPLYPLLVRFFVWLTGLSAGYAGVISSTIFLVIALVFVFRYISITRNSCYAFSVIVLMAFGPYSFYYSSLYTESLFVALTAICFYFLEKERWLLCGIFGALLSATRPVGVFFFIPLLLKIITPYVIKHESLFGTIKSVINNEKQVFSLLLVPAGLFAYMTYLYFYVGDPFAFQHIQISWGRENGNPFIVLYRGLLGQGAFGGIQSQYLSLWGLLGLVLSGYLIIQKRYYEGIFALFCILIPMTSNVQSLPRYLMGSVVLVYAINDILSRFNKFKWPIIAALSSINVLLLFLWFSGHLITT